MEKKILFVAFFLVTIFFTSAQSEAVVSNELNTQAFTFGANKNLSAPAIVAVTAGTGSAQTNKNNWLAILSDATDDGNGNFTSSDNVQGTFTFTIKTEGDDINSNISITLAKRMGNSVTGSVDLGGVQATTFSDLRDGTTENTLEDFAVNLQNVQLTATPLTVIINLNSLLIGDQNTAGVPTLRLISASIEKTPSLSINDNDFSSTKITAYPNPVTNSFQIDSNINIENIDLYTVHGQLLKSFKANANYNISDLAKGVYIVKVKSASGKETLKIIKE